MENMKKFIIVGLLLGVACCQGLAKNQRTAKSSVPKAAKMSQPKAKQASGPERDLMHAVERLDYNAIRRINQENPNLQQSMRSQVDNTNDNTNLRILISAANPGYGNSDANMIAAFSESGFQTRNPLEAVIRGSDIDLARDLIRSGANVNAISSWGSSVGVNASSLSRNLPELPLWESLLHVAVRFSNNEMVNLLLENGADVLALNEQEQLPIELDPNNQALQDATVEAIETQGRTDLADRLR